MTTYRLLQLLALFVCTNLTAANAQQPIARYTFDGQKDNKGTGKGTCHLNNFVEFRGNAIYVNGVYEYSGSFDDPLFRGFQVFCGAPEIGFEKFSVVVRFNAENFDDTQNVIVMGGKSWRWFGLTRSDTGKLVLNLNSGKFKQEFPDSTVEAKRWVTVACAVNIPAHRVVAFIDGKECGVIKLPDDLKIDEPDEEKVVAEAPFFGDKIFTFANYATAGVFRGLVDGLVVYDRELSNAEMSELSRVRESRKSVVEIPQTTTNRNAEDAVALYRFNGNADNEGVGKGTCYLGQGVSFLDNAVMTYKDVWCGAPEIEFSRFSVVVRLKSGGFSNKKQEVIVVGGRSQWFSLNRSADGILSMELNRGKFKKEFGGKNLAEDQWIKIACSIDLESHRAVAFVDGELAGEIDLPLDLKIDMPETSKELLVAPLYGDKVFVFANYGKIGSQFKGSVDELQIYGRVLSKREMLTLTDPKVDKP